MDADKTSRLDGGSVIPNTFVIHLNDVARSALGYLEKHLVAELIDAAKQYAADEVYTLAGDVSGSIIIDADRKAGKFLRQIDFPHDCPDKSYE